MDKRTKKEILDTPAGQKLNALVEKEVFDLLTCTCEPIGGYDPDSGICSRCRGRLAYEWSESHTAGHMLIRAIQENWPFQRLMRFLDFLGEAISYRLGVGKVEPRQWIMHYLPEDICRAALLTLMEQKQ